MLAFYRSFQISRVEQSKEPTKLWSAAIRGRWKSFRTCFRKAMPSVDTWRWDSHQANSALQKSRVLWRIHLVPHDLHLVFYLPPSGRRHFPHLPLCNYIILPNSETGPLLHGSTLLYYILNFRYLSTWHQHIIQRRLLIIGRSCSLQTVLSHQHGSMVSLLDSQTQGSSRFQSGGQGCRCCAWSFPR